MPFIDPNKGERKSPPHAPDEWYELRPIMAGDLNDLDVVGSQIRIAHDLMAKLIVAWYDAERPIDLANVGMLDLETYGWLTDEIGKLSNIRPDAEKKASSTGLPRGPRAQAESREPSVIS